MALFQSDHPSVETRLFSLRCAAIIHGLVFLSLVRLSQSLASRGYLLNVTECENVGHALRFGALSDVTPQVLTQ